MKHTGSIVFYWEAHKEANPEPFAKGWPDGIGVSMYLYFH